MGEFFKGRDDLMDEWMNFEGCGGDATAKIDKEDLN